MNNNVIEVQSQFGFYTLTPTDDIIFIEVKSKRLKRIQHLDAGGQLIAANPVFYIVGQTQEKEEELITEVLLNVNAQP